MIAAAVVAAPLLSPGARLGRYEVVRRLDVGGMAEILLARRSGPEGFEKHVVLKRILPQLASDEEFVRMFLDEARLAATLQHPNIAQVYDIDQDGGEYFFAMEYVPGKNLHQIMRAVERQGGPLPLDHALAIVLGVAAGLHYAHEKRDERGAPLGIVHRDVSPSNVLVSVDGAVKLVDFGIAKAASQRSVTRQGLLKGKIAYMSPEQCLGGAVDRRSDVFALGILLYELTAGGRLFAGDNEYAILHKITDVDVPRPSARAPGYPPELEAIVMRALRRDRETRYRTAQELQIDLENFARDRRLVVSAIEVARTMEGLFGSDPRAAAPEAPSTVAEPPLRLRADEGLRPVEPSAPRGRSRRAAVALAAVAVAGAGALLLARRRPGPPGTAAVATPAPPVDLPPAAADPPAAAPPPEPEPGAADPATPTPPPRRRPKPPRRAPAEAPAWNLDDPFPPKRR